MFRTVFLVALAALATAQYQSDPRNAAILSEARYLSNDGKFGASYSQEDGVEFKEESDPDGTRRGQYSYVDPSGQRRTVTYTAGKHGFQASGDHLPSAPVGAAPTPGYVPDPQYQSPPQQQYQSQPQYQAPQQQYRPAPQQYRPQPQQYQAPQQQQYQAPQQQYQAPQQQYQPAPQQQYQPAPQQQYRTTTPAPHRFYPPGKLNLNRSPDGFSYTFNKS